MSIRVWRYMSFGRFVWTLKARSLWMSRSDQLGDVWEGLFSEEELKAMTRRAVAELPEEYKIDDVLEKELFTRRLASKVASQIRTHRERFFINCWTASNSESHAMWSIYCASKEGVAIQTTLEKLRASVGDLQVLPVTYRDFVPKGEEKHKRLDLVTRKRKPFSYEKERRIVAERDPPKEGTLAAMGGQPLGFALPWNPERWLDAVMVHPGSDAAFYEAVEAVIGLMAPRLKNRLAKSGMGALPPG